MTSSIRNNNEVATTYAETLRGIRERHGLSLRVAAGLIGVSHVYLGDTERGNRPPMARERSMQALVALSASDEERASLMSFYCEHCGAKR